MEGTWGETTTAAWQRQWWRLIAVGVMIVSLGWGPAAAQGCVGDCNGDGMVEVTDLIMGVNIALGLQPITACEAFANQNEQVDVSQLIKGVNNALNGCVGPTITVTGSCAAPGAGSHGLKACDAGTPITVFRCDDRAQCLHQQALQQVGATAVTSNGGWSVQISLADASASLIFQASLAKAVVYRTLGFGKVGGALRTGLARDVTFAPVDITPVTEAAVELLDSNGYQNYPDTGAQQVLTAVEQATADLSFADVAPDKAAALALQKASADPMVIMVLQSARGTVEQGLQALAAGDLAAARDAFGAAAAAHPGDGAAQLYAVFSRLGVEVLTDQRLLTMLDATGAHLTGNVAQVCSFKVASPVVVPTMAPRVDAIVDATRDIFLPRIADALTGLQAAIDANTALPFDTKYIPSCAGSSRSSLPILDVDRGDFMAVHAGLQVAVALINLGGAYDLGIGLHDLSTLPFQQLLTENPSLFTLRSTDRLAAARDAFDAAIREGVATVAEIRGEQDPQDDDLLVIMPQDGAETDRFVQDANLVRQSLHGEVVIPAQDGLPRSQRLNLSRFFNGTFPSLRAFVSFGADGKIDLRHVPDPTFGGIAPDLTQADINQFIDGGPLCAACQTDADCAGFGPQRLYCGACFDQCTGTTMRCTGNAFAQCSDGVF